MPDVIEQPKTTALERRAISAADTVTDLVVNDDDSYENAAEIQRGLKALKDEIVAFLDPHIKRAHEAHKALTAQRKALVAPLDVAIDTTKRLMGAYHAELERQRIEDEARLRAEAAKQAQAANEAEAQHAEFMGDERRAEEMRRMQDVVASMAANAVEPVENMKPKIDGARTTVTWRFEVIDPKLVPAQFLIPNEKAIGAYVRAMKGAASIPGVRVWCEHKVSV